MEIKWLGDQFVTTFLPDAVAIDTKLYLSQASLSHGVTCLTKKPTMNGGPPGWLQLNDSPLGNENTELSPSLSFASLNQSVSFPKLSYRHWADGIDQDVPAPLCATSFPGNLVLWDGRSRP